MTKSNSKKNKYKQKYYRELFVEVIMPTVHVLKDTFLISLGPYFLAALD